MNTRNVLSRIRAFNLRLNDVLFPPGMPAYYLRFRELASDLGAEADTVLHLGAGPVDLESVVPSLAQRPRLVTLDLSPEALHKNSASRRICGNAEALPLASCSIDLILAEQVFEHLPRPSLCLRECFRVLKEEGRLVVSGPNGLSYISLLARLTALSLHRWAQHFASGSSDSEVFETYYRFSRPHAIRRLAAKSGFDVVSVDTFVGPPCYTIALPVIHLVFMAYHFALEKLRTLCGFHITHVVVLEKPACACSQQRDDSQRREQEHSVEAIYRGRSVA